MTQDCLLAACKERRLLRREGRWNRVSDQVHASVDLVEAPAPESKLDLPSRHTGLKELPPRHNPVLPAG